MFVMFVSVGVTGTNKNDLGIKFHAMGEWVVGLIRLRSDPAVVDLSGKPFCSHPFYSS
jgi:hypothetical protein